MLTFFIMAFVLVSQKIINNTRQPNCSYFNFKALLASTQQIIPMCVNRKQILIISEFLWVTVYLIKVGVGTSGWQVCLKAAIKVLVRIVTISRLHPHSYWWVLLATDINPWPRWSLITQKICSPKGCVHG